MTPTLTVAAIDAAAEVLKNSVLSTTDDTFRTITAFGVVGAALPLLDRADGAADLSVVAGWRITRDAANAAADALRGRAGTETRAAAIEIAAVRAIAAALAADPGKEG